MWMRAIRFVRDSTEWQGIKKKKKTNDLNTWYLECKY